MEKMLKKLAKLLGHHKLDQKEVEQLCGLPHGRISKWNSGQGEPTARQALRIADCLKVPLRFLIDDSMDSPEADLSEAQRRLIFMAEQVGYDEAAKLILDGLKRQAGGPMQPVAPSSASQSGPYRTIGTVDFTDTLMANQRTENAVKRGKSSPKSTNEPASLKGRKGKS